MTENVEYRTVGELNNTDKIIEFIKKALAYDISKKIRTNKY